MEQINFGYSTKNIPVASHSQYRLRLIEMTEQLIKRLRWRAFFHLNPAAKNNTTETFGFRSTKPAPHIHELTDFEKKIIDLIHNIKFKPYSNSFQTKLKTDIKQTKTCTNLLVKADKTTNYYKLKPDQYTSLTHSNVTKSYKLAPDSHTDKITNIDKNIATSLDLDSRIERLAEKTAFITLKDHKPNFQNKPTCRLINPTKSEIGKISKRILEKINKTLTVKTNINLWRKTADVIDWFKCIKNKHSCSFLTFDVVDFYPSITQELLEQALDFAGKYVKITDQDKQIILHAKNSILVHNDQTWVKKSSSNKTFDVTMGSFDGAETCELVGTYMLSLLPRQLRENIGLYRDDGLAISTACPQNIERLKKLICKIFNQHKLKLTIEANKKSVNFLDVTFNLNANTYSPYAKPSNTTLYVHKNSNHPPTVIKNLPHNINLRLTTLSSNEHEFSKAAPPYQKALNDSGYNHTLKYKHIPTQPATNKRQRKRPVTWYNPPFNADVQTNIGRKFINIIDTCFPPTHSLHKVFNRHTLKLSYSCMPNMKQHIDSHNRRLLSSQQSTTTNRTCNCRVRNNCPLDGNCLTTNIIYQAIVTKEDTGTESTYIGLCTTDFKSRFRNHTASFTHSDKQNSTELSKHIWKLKNDNASYRIKWKIMQKARPYSNQTKKCHLCLSEKYYIICRPETATLNKRNEINNTCRHSKKYLLSQYDPGRGGATDTTNNIRRGNSTRHSTQVT